MEQFAKMVGAVIIGILIVHIGKHAMKEKREHRDRDDNYDSEYDPTTAVS